MTPFTDIVMSRDYIFEYTADAGRPGWPSDKSISKVQMQNMQILFITAHFISLQQDNCEERHNFRNIGKPARPGADLFSYLIIQYSSGRQYFHIR